MVAALLTLMRSALKGAMALALLIMIGAVVGWFLYRDRPLSESYVAVVTIEGPIVTASPWIDQIRELSRDEWVKGVVIRVDSPGGGVGASSELYQAIAKLDERLPVYASMGDVAASGGYYAAMGARKIFAAEGSITGSIGVLMEHADLSALLKWARVDAQTLKSGKYKDIGSPNRPMTAEEKKYIESLLAELHGQFKDVVSVSRRLPIETVNDLAQGQVFSGKMAQSLGLVDEIGTLNDAMDAVAKEAGLDADYHYEMIGDDDEWWMRLATKAMMHMDHIASRLAMASGERWRY